MKLKTVIVTLVLSALPSLGLTQGCSHDRQAMSCAEGTSFDSATGTCVDTPTT